MVTIESGKLGELFKIKQNKMPIKNNEMVVFLGMEDVSEDGKIVNQHVLPFSEIKKGLTYFEKNDILVAKITPCFENGKLGKS
jgi:type I restriction enzyme S subunit